MLKCIFLIPIDHRGIQGRLFTQYLDLQSWCERNNSTILTCNGLFLNFARNLLATGGKGYSDTSPPKAEWLFWIDSDIKFSIEQIEYLLNEVPEENLFATGWYQSDHGDKAMVGSWDEEYFKENLHMPFTSAKWLLEMAKEDTRKIVQVDWCGFGFTKVHRSIYEQMDYPYYPLNEIEIEGCRDPKNEGEKITIKALSFEDVSFCRNCYKTTGIKPVVIPELRVAHLKSYFV